MNRILLLGVLFFLNINATSYAQDITKVSKDENKYVYSNSIKIFMDDSIYVKAKMVDNNLINFTLTDTADDSTIIFGLRYSKFGSHNATFLIVKHPYSKELAYDAKVRISPLVSYSSTTIMPVFPKIPGIEV